MTLAKVILYAKPVILQLHNRGRAVAENREKYSISNGLRAQQVTSASSDAADEHREVLRHLTNILGMQQCQVIAGDIHHGQPTTRDGFPPQLRP